MEYMATLPDKAFELAVVDPPYGIGCDGQKFSQHFKKGARKAYDFKGWDILPDQQYFRELKRISQNQIIWGANYFINYLSPSPCFLMWDKIQSFTGADFELAYTSFKTPCKSFRMSRIEAYGNGGNSTYHNPNKIHPTQKPVALYQWLLKNYAKQGDKILDTHLGSGSSAIAADIMGFDFVGIEIDKDYYEAALDRFNRHKQQIVMEF